MKNLKITCIQTSLLWRDVKGNIENFQDKIDNITEPTDIILLPEMFSTGFAMEPATLAEKMDGSTVSWMKKMAQNKSTLIIGSLIIEYENKYKNRLLTVFPSGEIQFYDKHHLFSLAGENKIYSPGNQKLIIDYKSWKINVLICYDLRFPVWSRNQNNYDVLLYVANWPASRSNHWKILLQARAIENQAYVVGLNRIGPDGNGTPHSGDSCAFDPFGNNIYMAKSNTDCIDTIQIEKDVLEKIRNTYPFHKDSDNFMLI
jgi:predicted amidohydrolase